jgi:ABC-type oligopeptide transport system ATPase subunit
MKTPTLHFAVIGGRSFGKTTLATSLLNLSGSTDGVVSVKGKEADVLKVKNEKLHADGRVPATNEITDFHFVIRPSADESWTVVLKDYPGEFFEQYVNLSRGRSRKTPKGPGTPDTSSSPETTEDKIIAKRAMDSLKKGKARRLEREFYQNDAIIVLLPWDAIPVTEESSNSSDQVREQISKQIPEFKRRVCEFLEKSGASTKRIPVCLAVNKWDMNEDETRSLEAVLADGSKPFGAFFSDLKHIVGGENLFCKEVSAFGKHDSNDVGKFDSSGTPFNVLEMMIELARRTDRRQIETLENAWNGSSWFRKAVIVPIKSFCAKRRGCSSRKQVDRIDKYLRDGRRKFWKSAAIAIVVFGLATFLFNGYNAWNRLSGIMHEADGVGDIQQESRSRIQSLRKRFDAVSVWWRLLLGNAAKQRISQLECGFNEVVESECGNVITSPEFEDGRSIVSMSWDERWLRSERRRDQLNEAVDMLFESANKNEIRGRLNAGVEREKDFQEDLSAHRSFDEACYTRLNGIEAPGELARAEYDLISEYEKPDSPARPEDLVRLREELTANQAAATQELDETLSGLEALLASDSFATALERYKKMISRIDGMQERFVGTNFVRFADRKENLLAEAFVSTTNQLAAIGEKGTAVEKTLRADERIAVCEQAVVLWDSNDPRFARIETEKRNAIREKRELEPYVKWESDFDEQVKAVDGNNGRARQLEAFLNGHHRKDYPDYSRRWDELDSEKDRIVSDLLGDLDKQLSESRSATTNDVHASARTAVSNRIAKIDHVRSLLPKSRSIECDVRFEMEKERFSEIDKYERFDDEIETLETVSPDKKIERIKTFLKVTSAIDYPRRKPIIDRLTDECSRLVAGETNKYSAIIVKNADNSDEAAATRISKAEQRIEACNAILQRISDYSPALIQKDADVSFTNAWTKYAALERKWKKQVEEGVAEERARRMAEFLDGNPKENFPFYGEKFDEATKEMNRLANEEWLELTQYLTTNRVDGGKGPAVASELRARIAKSRKRLPDSYASELDELDNSVDRDEKEFEEKADKYKRFDEEFGGLKSVALDEKIARTRRFLDSHTATVFPERKDQISELADELSELVNRETDKYDAVMSGNADDSKDSATVRIANAERRIGACNAVLKRIPDYSPALIQKDAAVSFTNDWAKYAELENRWKNEVETGALEEKSKRMEMFFGNNPKEKFPFYGNKYDAAIKEMEALAKDEWVALEAYCRTNAIVYGGKRLRCEDAATNQMKRIDLARRRLPASYKGKLDDLDSTVRNQLAKVGRMKEIDQAESAVTNAPLKSRLAAVAEFRKNHPDEASRMTEIERNAVDEIERLFSKRISVEEPPSTNFIESAEYHIRKADAYSKEAEFFPEGWPQRDALLGLSQDESSFAEQFRTWERIRIAVLNIPTNDPSETCAYLFQFDTKFTNDWDVSSPIHPYFAKSRKLLEEAERSINTDRDNRLNTLGSETGLDLKSRIDFSAKRIDIYRDFDNGKYYPGSDLDGVNKRALETEEKKKTRLETQQKFELEYSKLKRDSKKEIQDFLVKFPRENYIPLAGDIEDKYAALDAILSRLQKQENWNNLARETEAILGREPRDASSYLAELDEQKTKVEEWLKEPDFVARASALLEKIKIRRGDIDSPGKKSFDIVKEYWKRYENEPSEDNFTTLNNSLNEFDVTKAQPDEKDSLEKWRKALRDDAIAIRSLREALSQFLTNPTEGRFATLVGRYKGLKDPTSNVTHLSQPVDKYSFWKKLETFIEIVANPGNRESFHWFAIRTTMKPEVGRNELVVTATRENGTKGVQVFNKSRIGEGDITYPINEKCLGDKIVIKGEEPHVVNRYEIYARGAETGKCSYPGNGIGVFKKSGKPRGHVFIRIDGLPTVSIPDGYKFLEKHK